MSNEILIHALQRIALGRTDGGRALAGATAMQIAREALTECQMSWGVRERLPSSPVHYIDGPGRPVLTRAAARFFASWCEAQ